MEIKVSKPIYFNLIQIFDSFKPDTTQGWGQIPLLLVQCDKNPRNKVEFTIVEATLVKFAVGVEALSVRAATKDEEEWRKSMKTHTHTLPLPPELIREILLSLPVNSLLQCKRVCKAWLSLISDPQFFISHYVLAVSHPPMINCFS